jgi:hypothetical protein
MIAHEYGFTPPEADTVAEYDLPWVAAAKPVVEIDNAEAATVMVRGWLATCGDGAEWSTTCMVKLDVPDPVGVPEILPLEASSVMPAGSAPVVIDQL